MGCENAEMRFRVIGGCIEGEKRGLQRGQVDRHRDDMLGHKES